MSDIMKTKSKIRNFATLGDVHCCDLCNSAAGRLVAMSSAITPDMGRLGMSKGSSGMANSMQSLGIVVSFQPQDVFRIDKAAWDNTGMMNTPTSTIDEQPR